MGMQFQMKELGELKCFLSLEVERCGISMSAQYAKNLLQTFGLLDYKPILTLKKVNAKLCSSEDKDLKDIIIYKDW